MLDYVELARVIGADLEDGSANGAAWRLHIIRGSADSLWHIAEREAAVLDGCVRRKPNTHSSKRAMEIMRISVEADLATKEATLDTLTLPKPAVRHFKPDEALLAFLANL